MRTNFVPSCAAYTEQGSQAASAARSRLGAAMKVYAYMYTYMRIYVCLSYTCVLELTRIEL
jgi:hypothetical protein